MPAGWRSTILRSPKCLLSLGLGGWAQMCHGRARHPRLLRGFAGHTLLSSASAVQVWSWRAWPSLFWLYAFGTAHRRRHHRPLLVLIAPAFTTIKGGTDVTSAAYTIKGVLDTARTYAKANNTYTWVGFLRRMLPTVTGSSTAGAGRIVVPSLLQRTE